jgi:hypothetical protein
MLGGLEPHSSRPAAGNQTRTAIPASGCPGSPWALADRALIPARIPGCILHHIERSGVTVGAHADVPTAAAYRQAPEPGSLEAAAAMVFVPRPGGDQASGGHFQAPVDQNANDGVEPGRLPQQPALVEECFRTAALSLVMAAFHLAMNASGVIVRCSLCSAHQCATAAATVHPREPAYDDVWEPTSLRWSARW